MNVGSLFTGIGGIDLGLERAGMHVAWQCESDAYCRAVLERHWPDVLCYPDVRDIGTATAPVDVLAGGFPCQPVSVAGRGLAQVDERWIWPEFARLIRILRPRYVLVENVPGLLTRGMGDILADLAAGGYDAEWDCIGAVDIGAPHRRKRVWVVAYPNCVDGRGRPTRGRVQTPARTGSETTGVLANADGERWDGRPRIFGPAGRRQLADSREWQPEPDVGRVAHGVPHRVDRLRALGNAVVPQVAEWIGRRMMEAADA